ncbi:uncharacterized protein BT62DRAFT_937808 [Guyanagaster necrorhizus]|uniref:Uncharacterized protein n=1 Tax=Guyanagaster necrorhizus TaxID=856835 RepID=A0A9P8AMF1_9AGAR|nr:uncharacterized protein BT62DRAFT_937808 [Guyanagaster necrorhizus MCA 3950]KAG7440674.1 hypothetical protein BT62DRAFT_937808 [Guyanagaster necrorhizus MCA 3950]
MKQKLSARTMEPHCWVQERESGIASDSLGYGYEQMGIYGNATRDLGGNGRCQRSQLLFPFPQCDCKHNIQKNIEVDLIASATTMDVFLPL